MKKRLKKKIYRKYIEDIAMDISLDSRWRSKIFNSNFNTCVLIKDEKDTPLPPYLANIIRKNNILYSVKKVKECNDDLDDSLIIFKFESVEFPTIVKYTGNNPDIL